MASGSKAIDEGFSTFVAMRQKQLQRIIADITDRSESLFQADLEAYNNQLRETVEGKSVLVIGGAGTIGFNFIKALLRFPIKELVIVDLNENGLAEVIRDIRSSDNLHIPDITTYPLSFGSSIFKRLFEEHEGFDIVANFAALKHVRTAKDSYAIQAMFETNFIMAGELLQLLSRFQPERFFCVSTDKATNPVSVMGATKKLMEDVVFSYKNQFTISTARFANVAFSNGSLLESYINRYNKNQPLVCPADIKRFFVSPTESGELCLAAAILGSSGDIFIPKLNEAHLTPFSRTVEAFLKELNLEAVHCSSEGEARKMAQELDTTKQYPIMLFNSDTSGEKPYEEFYNETDTVDTNTFHGLGVIKDYRPAIADGAAIIEEAQLMFQRTPDKNEIADFLVKYIPEFEYLDRGKTLDQKM